MTQPNLPNLINEAARRIELIALQMANRIELRQGITRADVNQWVSTIQDEVSVLRSSAKVLDK